MESSANSGVAVLPTGMAFTRRSRPVPGSPGLGRCVQERQRAVRRRHPGAVLDVLDPERHPGQRSGIAAAVEFGVDAGGGPLGLLPSR